MSTKTLIVMAIALVIIMPIVAVVLEKIDTKDKSKNNVSAILYLKKSRNNPIYSIYKFLYNFPMTSGYMQMISRRYEIISPTNPHSIANKTMVLAGTTLVLCMAEIVLTYLLRPDLNNLVLAIYLIFVINNEVINYYISTAELKLLEELGRFISNVSHNYFHNYYIDDAILDAVDSRMSNEMKIHAKILYEIVTSDTLKENVARYNTTMHNKYLKMFLSLCINVMENGDKNLNGQRLLTLNLISLKKEINLEYLKQRKLRFVFSGSIFAAVSVCIPLTMIQDFGISIAPELERVYTGQIGILYTGLIFITSAVIYVMINNAKETKKPIAKNYIYLKILEGNYIINKALENFTEKFYSITRMVRDTLKRLGETITPKQLLLKSIITSIITCLFCISLMSYIHENNKELIIGKVTNIENITSASTSELSESMKEAILKYTDLYKKETVTREFIMNQVESEGMIYNETIITDISKEVISRISQYQREYFKWYELLICIVIGIISFFLPFLMILYRRKLLKANMEDEVIQFSSIIYMMMYSDHVTVMDILEQMELFAVVFKPTLRECINEYNSGDIEALEKMKEREKYEPFLQLIDNLIRCDDISIMNSFDEIASDRENYYDRRKLENDITIQKRADNIKPLAFLPGILVIIYLIMPLLYTSLQGLLDLKNMIQEMGII